MTQLFSNKAVLSDIRLFLVLKSDLSSASNRLQHSSILHNPSPYSGSVNGHLGSVNDHLGSVNGHLGSVNGHLGSVNNHLGSINSPPLLYAGPVNPQPSPSSGYNHSGPYTGPNPGPYTGPNPGPFTGPSQPVYPTNTYSQQQQQQLLLLQQQQQKHHYNSPIPAFSVGATNGKFVEEGV